MRVEKVLIIWNPLSGRTHFDRRRSLLETFMSHGVRAEVRRFDSDRLSDWIAKAEEEGLDAVFAGGGDGTVSAVAAQVSRSNLPLGIIPLGTFNHFARDLGLPLDWKKAVASLLQGRVQRIDMGEVNGRRFLNNSSIGLYPLLVSIRERERKARRAGKLFATSLAFLRVLVRFRLRKVRIAAGDFTVTSRTPFVFVGNNLYDLSLMHFGRRRALDQGRLTLYLARCRTRRSVFRLALRTLFNRLIQDRDFQSRQVDQVKVTTRRKRLMVSLDGEVYKLNSPLHYRSLAGALAVLLPEDRVK
ncbi:MAG TPA: diacylglycerol kinase family protein [Acidobacteriota bacterium]|nr:diacylglycerol kinase family protein [Acidobacteriota bacterium]